MSQIYAPLQLYNLLKSCMIIFLIQAVIVLFAPFIPNLTVRLLILSFNVIVSALLGWHLYKRIYHMVFTFDGKGFTLKKGMKEETIHKWNEFSQVSLVRNEEGNFNLRLYEGGEFFDLPASKLKLNPFDFRLEVMGLVNGSKDRRQY